MITENKRIFLGISISYEISKKIEAVIQNLSAKTTKLEITWVRPGNFHITLRFFGSLPALSLKETSDQIRQIANRYSRFEIQLKEVGTFPAARGGKVCLNPRVIWVGIEDPWQNLKRIAHDAHSIRIGSREIKEEILFVPHLTIGRVKAGKIDSNKICHPFRGQVYGSLKVNEIVLYSSETKRTGPEYGVLERFNLLDFHGCCQ